MRVYETGPPPPMAPVVEPPQYRPPPPPGGGGTPGGPGGHPGTPGPHPGGGPPPPKPPIPGRKPPVKGGMSVSIDVTFNGPVSSHKVYTDANAALLDVRTFLATGTTPGSGGPTNITVVNHGPADSTRSVVIAQTAHAAA